MSGWLGQQVRGGAQSSPLYKSAKALEDVSLKKLSVSLFLVSHSSLPVLNLLEGKAKSLFVLFRLEMSGQMGEGEG